MNYSETLDWLFAQLPMYQRQGKSAYKADLNNTIQLAKYLKNPEKKFKSIHVGGTNGKGSTSHYLTSILMEAGYKVGLYTSPHLVDFRERIRINGQPIPPKNVVDFVQSHKTFFETNQLSFFEMSVGLAFDFFAQQKVDIAVIEVGMGGRLDSTNIIQPELSVITNISLDHTHFLGNNLSAIAREKAGIIKPKTPVVIGEKNHITQPIFTEFAQLHQTEMYFSETMDLSTIQVNDLPDYQLMNLKTVLQSVEILQQKGWQINQLHIQEGVQRVKQNTGLRGRWEVLQQSPKIICDTGHNTAGLQHIVQQLEKESFDQLWIVFGVVNDKDLAAILPLLPKQAYYIFCQPAIPRALAAEDLKNAAMQYKLVGEIVHQPIEALAYVKAKAKPKDLIYIGGSTFVVADVLKNL
ncbi:MAG: bifunctional folylpolyglutamate synthase/dihydrofolate synthase [Bacteroidota bacterium]